MKRAMALAVLTAMLMTVMTTVFPAVSEAQDETTITILHNNDGESNLLPDEESGDPGIARFVATLEQLQADAPGDGVVTLTSGDNYLASKEFTAAIENGVPYYDSIALSGLYDAMALGNHDFDLGPDITADFISGFDPAVPFLSANADFSGEPMLQALVDEGRIAASTVVETAAGPVGVIGAITPRLPNISSPRNVVIDSDVVGAVNAEAAALEAEGVNRIILISHLQGLAQDREIVPQLEGVDVVIAGGGDELLKNEGDTCLPEEEAAAPYPSFIGDIPVVVGPGGYRCIGQLNVTFDADGNVTNAEGMAIGVGLDVEPDPDVQAAVVEPVAAAVEGLTTTVIGTSEVALDGQRASVRTMSTNEGSLLADGILSSAQRLAPGFTEMTPTVAITNGGGIRNDAVIPAGEITLADTFDIAPFSNFVVIMEVPRETLEDLLENAVSGLPEAEGRFAQVSGLTMTVDLAGEPRGIDQEGDCALVGAEGSRVTDVVLDDGTVIIEGGEVVPGDPVVIATVNFLASGGDCWPLGDIESVNVGTTYQRALASHISDELGGSITAADYPEDDTRITIVDDTVGGTGGDDGSADDEASDDADATDDADAADDTAADDAALADTGSDNLPLAVGAFGLVAAGAMLVREGRRIRRY